MNRIAGFTGYQCALPLLGRSSAISFREAAVPDPSVVAVKSDGVQVLNLRSRTSRFFPFPGGPGVTRKEFKAVMEDGSFLTKLEEFKGLRAMR